MSKHASLKVTYLGGDVKHLCKTHCLEHKIEPGVALMLMESEPFQETFGMKAEFSQVPCTECKGVSHEAD